MGSLSRESSKIVAGGVWCSNWWELLVVLGSDGGVSSAISITSGFARGVVGVGVVGGADATKYYKY